MTKIIKTTRDNLLPPWAHDDVKWKEFLTSVDDSTTHVTVATPKGWKCKRKGCITGFLHEHSTYPALKSSDKMN